MGKISLILILALALLILVGSGASAANKGNPNKGKAVIGHINSSGRTDGGVIYYHSPNYYLLLNRKSYTMEKPPSVNPLNRRLPILCDEDRYVIAGLDASGVVVYWYQKVKSKGKDKSPDYQIYRKDTLSQPDAEHPKFSNMKRLQSGAILAIWQEEKHSNYTAYPRFSYWDGVKWTCTEAEYTGINGGAPWITADFAQDSVGDIWWFGKKDANKNMARIHLREINGSVEVLEIEPYFIPKDDTMQAEGELPFIVAEYYKESIILAYHSIDYFMGSQPPLAWYKGAKINIVRVVGDERELLYQTDYAERITPFGLVGTSIITNVLDITNGTYQNLHLFKEDGSDALLTDAIRFPHLFRYTDNQCIYNSQSGEIITMEI